jgi:hypothetical protein
MGPQKPYRSGVDRLVEGFLAHVGELNKNRSRSWIVGISCVLMVLVKRKNG